MIKCWIHLENNGDTLLREALFVSKCLHENGKESWYSCSKGSGASGSQTL